MEIKHHKIIFIALNVIFVFNGGRGEEFARANLLRADLANGRFVELRNINTDIKVFKVSCISFIISVYVIITMQNCCHTLCKIIYIFNEQFASVMAR